MLHIIYETSRNCTCTEVDDGRKEQIKQCKTEYVMVKSDERWCGRSPVFWNIRNNLHKSCPSRWHCSLHETNEIGNAVGKKQRLGWFSEKKLINLKHQKKKKNHHHPMIFPHSKLAATDLLLHLLLSLCFSSNYFMSIFWYCASIQNNCCSLILFF